MIGADLLSQTVRTAAGSRVQVREALGERAVLALYFVHPLAEADRRFTAELGPAYRTYGSAGPVGLLLVPLADSPLDPALEALALPVWLAGPSLAARYGVGYTPCLVVVDAQDGSVITRDGGTAVTRQGHAAFASWEPPAQPDVDTSSVAALGANPDPWQRVVAQMLVDRVAQLLSGSAAARSFGLCDPRWAEASGLFQILRALGFERDGHGLHFPTYGSFYVLRAFRTALQQVLDEPAPPPPATVTRPPVPIVPAPLPMGHLLTYMTNESEFYQKMVAESQHVMKFENPQAQSRARRVVPIEKLESRALAQLNRLRRAHRPASGIMLRDLLLLELLAWFKNDFFVWVNSPNCGFCGGSSVHSGYRAPTSQEQMDGASVVEGFVCQACEQEVRFPRYHSKPEKLLETRRGRCGEWANCFALICRSMGFDTRHVLDWTDHVWVEVFSQAENRWLHADPCENTCDKPLLYEVGWGKKLTYVIATSKDEVQDVTYRYSRDHAALRSRRTKVRERWLTESLLKLTNDIQRGFERNRMLQLTERRLIELVHLLEPLDQPSHTDGERLSGRQSGSIAWKMARGEMGLDEDPDRKRTWELAPAEVDSQVFHLAYNVVRDEYTRVSNGNEIVNGWDYGTCEVEGMERIQQSDEWSLARKEDVGQASMKWKLDLSKTRLSVQSVKLSISSSTDASGRVVWQLYGDSRGLLPSPDSTFESDALTGSKTLSLRVLMWGELACRDFRLFATPTSESEAIQLRWVVQLREDAT
eukprot:maker-scaffold244_size240795-snap-gene-1.29 protein:Tk02100 transcript:maker-scaffold244_size240795-snap-gene-1.29-mRNA-1 annotation:"peptide-n -(n-acetyl-beta-glucosaminyl)asparagine amidase"